MSKGMKGIYNFFRTPYYWVWLKHNGVVVWTDCIPIKKVTRGWIHVKKFKSAYLLPEFSSRIPPLKFKSGEVLVYDLKNAVQNDILRQSQLKEELTGDGFLSRLYGAAFPGSVSVTNTIEPEYFVARTVDPVFLDTFLEGKIAQDIIAEPESKMPLILIIVAIVAIVAIACVVAWLLIHGNTINIGNATYIQSTIPGETGFSPLP